MALQDIINNVKWFFWGNKQPVQQQVNSPVAPVLPTQQDLANIDFSQVSPAQDLFNQLPQQQQQQQTNTLLDTDQGLLNTVSDWQLTSSVPDLSNQSIEAEINPLTVGSIDFTSAWKELLDKNNKVLDFLNIDAPTSIKPISFASAIANPAQAIATGIAKQTLEWTGRQAKAAIDFLDEAIFDSSKEAIVNELLPETEGRSKFSRLFKNEFTQAYEDKIASAQQWIVEQSAIDWEYESYEVWYNNLISKEESNDIGSAWIKLTRKQFNAISNDIRKDVMTQRKEQEKVQARVNEARKSAWIVSNTPELEDRMNQALQELAQDSTKTKGEIIEFERAIIWLSNDFAKGDAIVDSAALKLADGIARWFSQERIDALQATVEKMNKENNLSKERLLKLSWLQINWNLTKDNLLSLMAGEWLYDPGDDKQKTKFSIMSQPEIETIYLNWGRGRTISRLDLLYRFNSDAASLVWWAWPESIAKIPSFVANLYASPVRRIFQEQIEWAFDTALSLVSSWDFERAVLQDNSLKNIRSHEEAIETGGKKNRLRWYSLGLFWVLPEAGYVAASLLAWGSWTIGWFRAANTLSYKVLTKAGTLSYKNLTKAGISKKTAISISKAVNLSSPRSINLYNKYGAAALADLKLEALIAPLDPQIWERASDNLLNIWFYASTILETVFKWFKLTNYIPSWEATSFAKRTLDEINNIEWALDSGFEIASLNKIAESYDSFMTTFRKEAERIEAWWGTIDNQISNTIIKNAETEAKKQFWISIANKVLVEEALNKGIVKRSLVFKALSEWNQEALIKLDTQLQNLDITKEMQNLFNDILVKVDSDKPFYDMFIDFTGIDISNGTSKKLSFSSQNIPSASAISAPAYQIRRSIAEAFPQWKAITTKEIYTNNEVKQIVKNTESGVYRIEKSDFNKVDWWYSLKTEALWSDKWIVKLQFNWDDIDVLVKDEDSFLETMEIIGASEWFAFESWLIKQLGVYDKVSNILSKIIC